VKKARSKEILEEKYGEIGRRPFRTGKGKSGRKRPTWLKTLEDVRMRGKGGKKFLSEKGANWGNRQVQL